MWLLVRISHDQLKGFSKDKQRYQLQRIVGSNSDLLLTFVVPTSLLDPLGPSSFTYLSLLSATLIDHAIPKDAKASVVGEEQSRVYRPVMLDLCS